MSQDIVFCWSGGKDSAMALHALRSAGEFRIAALLTTVTDEYDRISMHGVRRVLLERQADSLGLPLHPILIPPQCVNATYEKRMKEALAEHFAQGVRHVAFGDIFLEDLRAYRERNLALIGMEGIFPIWMRDTHALAREFLQLGFRAITVCVNPQVLDSSFAGRELDAGFFADLPPAVDPCGENGEFHSPVRFRAGEKVKRDGFWFCDLLPE
jgi:uncharacterized protein (TIGR00290 family)